MVLAAFFSREEVKRHLKYPDWNEHEASEVS